MFDPTSIYKGKNPMVKATTKTTAATAGPGHNITGLDESQEKVFIREFGSIKALNTDMAGTKGEIGGAYKRLESAGFTKEHIAWAMKLEKSNVQEIIRDLRMKIAIAKLLGHGAGRQLDILDDRTPLEDQAFLEGLAIGKFGGDAANPYGMETAAGQNWTRGMQEGNVIRNAAINEAVNGTGQADIIKGPNAENGAGGADDQDGNDEDGSSDTTDDSDTGGSDGSAGETAPIEGEIIPPAAQANSEDDDWDAAAPKTEAPVAKKTRAKK